MGQVLGYGRHYVDEADIAAVAEVLRGDFLTQGPTVDRFEAALAEATGARYAVACANGTAALHLACLAAGAAAGWRSVTSTVTFVASANAMLYCGGDADVVDIDPITLSMDLGALERHLAIFPETQIIIPVHMAGLPDDMAAVRRIVGERVIIEDACHAFGARYADGAAVGSCQHSDMTCFSFHPVKPFTTGEGGAITTNDPELYRRLKLLRSHGIEREADRFVAKVAFDADGSVNPWHYEQQALGYNYRLTDLQAALGLSQLSKLDGFTDRRRQIAARYDIALAGLPGLVPAQATAEMRGRSAHHLYIVLLDFTRLGLSRRQLMTWLRERGVGTQVHYIPIHRQPFHRDRHSWAPGDFPAAEAYFAACLSIPIHPSMSDEDVDSVVAALKDLTRNPAPAPL